MAKAKKGGAKKAPAKKAKAAKAAKKTAAKKARWTAPGAKDRVTEAKAATRAPRQPALIKGVRIAALDRVFEHIADTRAAINRLRGEEADYERHAHRLMREHKKETWSWAGVEAARIPGEEKLRIRTSRETSTAENQEDAGPTQTEERADAVDAGDDDAELAQASDELEDAIDPDSVEGGVH